MPETPAYVVSARYDVLAWNHLATLFVGDLSGVPEGDRNMIRWMFNRPGDDSSWSDEDAFAFARSTVADLRSAYAKYPGSRDIDSLVTEMLALSPPFAAMWAAHEVSTRHATVKRVDHPLTGPIEFECQVMHIADTGQRLIAYVAAPGTPAREAFRRLASSRSPYPGI
jgi:hypothetical protein